MADIDFRADEDLADELEQPRRVDLVDPMTGEPIIDVNGKKAYVIVYSALSKRFKQRAFKVQGRAADIAKKMGGKIPLEMQEKFEAQVYACAFDDEWHIVKKNKADKKWHPIDAECNFDNVTNWVLANPLYRAQISAKTDNIQSFVDGDDANFTTEASPSSSKRSKAVSS